MSPLVRASHGIAAACSELHRAKGTASRHPGDWLRALPAGYEGQVVPPWSFRCDEDEEALATKLAGLDAEGRRCWARHDHTAVDERFDIDERPVAVLLTHERRTAWWLRSGQWLLQVDRIERMESCAPRVVNLAPVVVEECSLGL